MLDCRIFFIFGPILLPVFCARIPQIQEIESDDPINNYLHVCIHGEMADGKCACDHEYVGEFCEKKMHCANFRRYTNGSCTDCLQGFSGNYCENIQCVHGVVNARGTACNCAPPFTGTFCDEITTTNVYSYYNNKIYTLGPLGALALIPMCLTYFCCEKMAKKREVKRINNQLGTTQNIVTTNGALEYLLKNSV